MTIKNDEPPVVTGLREQLAKADASAAYWRAEHAALARAIREREMTYVLDGNDLCDWGLCKREDVNIERAAREAAEARAGALVIAWKTHVHDMSTSQLDRDRRILRKGFNAQTVGDQYVDDAIRQVDREIDAEKRAKETE